jgi:hypothetical protein
MFGPTRILVFGCPLLVVAFGTALVGGIVASVGGAMARTAVYYRSRRC